jgi:hypothetical protein
MQQLWEDAIVTAAVQGWSHNVIARAAGVNEVDVRRVLRKRERRSGTGDPGKEPA